MGKPINKVAGIVAAGAIIWGAAVGVPAAVTALGGNRHVEYHYSSPTISYTEVNPHSYSGYVGVYQEKNSDGSSIGIRDENNNLAVDKGDEIRLYDVNGKPTVLHVENPQSPNISAIVKTAQVKMDAGLAKILEENTVAVRK